MLSATPPPPFPPGVAGRREAFLVFSYQIKKECVKLLMQSGFILLFQVTLPRTFRRNPMPGTHTSHKMDAP